jgi:hypothetical protein
MHAAPLPAPNRLLSERLLLGPAIECGNVRNWVDSGMSAIGRQLAKADFADEFKILSLQSALGG